MDNYGQSVLQGSTLVNIDKRDCQYRKRFGFQSPHLHLIQVIGFGSNCFCPAGLKLGQRNCELSYMACLRLSIGFPSSRRKEKTHAMPRNTHI